LMKPGELKSQIRRDMNRTFQNHQSEGIQGLKDLGCRELSYKCVLSASVLLREGQDSETLGGEDGAAATITQRATNEETVERIHTIATSKNLKGERDTLERLADAIAPSIYGHNGIKRGLLLQMIGGVEKRTPEGTKLRSDINICLVGDPSSGKSSFLKYISAFNPRSVYTSGKTSTAAGLTASVTRDEDAQDMVIEPGALMLSDNGICCIDDFEKMNNKDMSAIHEAMEQQTISISKAGIHATLNARSSVLAGCNPEQGRYQPDKALVHNISLSAPIVSRFDLFFVLQDKPDDRDLDMRIAGHIIGIHHSYYKKKRSNGENNNTGRSSKRTRTAENQNNLIQTPPEDMDSESDSDGFGNDDLEGGVGLGGGEVDAILNVSQRDLLAYIQAAKQVDPQINDEAGRTLRRAYRRLRQEAHRSNTGYPITVRQLESLVRLSEAIARIYLCTDVDVSHVEKAFELMSSSFGTAVADRINLNADEEEERQYEQQLSFAEYQEITTMIVRRIQEHTEQYPGVDDPGLSEEDLQNWYMEQVADQLQDDKDMEVEEIKIRRVIRRMLEKDRVLIKKADKTLKTHPNYVPPPFLG